jgi:phage-related protein
MFSGQRRYCFKKTQKTPQKEIKMAEKLKKEYLKEKYGGQ